MWQWFGLRREQAFRCLRSLALGTCITTFFWLFLLVGGTGKHSLEHSTLWPQFWNSNSFRTCFLLVRIRSIWSFVTADWYVKFAIFLFCKCSLWSAENVSAAFPVSCCWEGQAVLLSLCAPQDNTWVLFLWWGLWSLTIPCLRDVKEIYLSALLCGAFYVLGNSWEFFTRKFQRLLSQPMCFHTAQQFNFPPDATFPLFANSSEGRCCRPHLCYVSQISQHFMKEMSSSFPVVQLVTE